MNKYLYGLCVVLLMSCSSVKPLTDQIEVAYLDSVSHYTLSGDKLEIETNNPMGMQIIDTFIVVRNQIDQNMVWIYGESSGKLLAKVISKGRGPDEVNILGLLNQSSNTLSGDPYVCIQGFPYYFGLLNIKKTIEEQKPVFTEQYNFDIEKHQTVLLQGNSVYYTRDSTLLIFQDPDRSKTIEHNPNPFVVKFDVARNLYFDTTYISSYSLADNKQNLILMSAASHFNVKQNKIALAYTYLDQIRIVDLQTKRSKVIGFNQVPMSVEQCLAESEVRFNGIYTTDSLIFVLSSLSDKNQRGKFENKIYILDWNGKLKCVLNLTGGYMGLPFVSPNNILYLMVGQQDIVKFDIGQFMK